MTDQRIVAVGLLTSNDVSLLGPTFDRLWPVEETPCFLELLRAIDEADRQPNAEEDKSLTPTKAQTALPAGGRKETPR